MSFTFSSTFDCDEEFPNSVICVMCPHFRELEVLATPTASNGNRVYRYISACLFYRRVSGDLRHNSWLKEDD